MKVKWAGQVRKGDVIVAEGEEYKVAKVESVFGGSWVNVFVQGHESEPVAFGGREQVTVK